MCRIDLRNLKTPRTDLWHVEIFLHWLGQVLVLGNFQTFDGVVT